MKSTDPYIETDLGREVAPGVWVFEDRDLVPLRPNTAIIVGTESVLVVDTGLGPENGALMLKKARELAAGKRLFLTTTHFHPEHAYGAQAFKDDAVIFCNKGQEIELREKGEWYLNRFKTIFSPKIAEMLDPVTLTAPHFTYGGDRMEIDLGARVVQLRNWGMAHTKGDQIVYIPDGRILITGDLLENSIFPIFPWLPPDDVNIDGDNWIRVLGAFLEYDPLIVVPGHGHVGGKAMIERALAFHLAMRSRVWSLREQGAGLDASIGIIKTEMEHEFGWEQPFWLQRATEYWWAAPRPA